MSTVHFYLNKGDYNRVKDLTAIEDFTLRHPQLVWSWGTYFRLKNRGYDVELICEIPKSGIVVMPVIYMEMLQKPPDNVLMICTLADSPPPFYTQVNLTQNPSQPSQYPNLFRWPVWRHISHWPQPGIIPRDETRGNRFERIAFFGHRDQLEPQLTGADFHQQLKTIGLEFEIREQNFSDYSGVDAVIAIRRFSADAFNYKPSTKLVNGWLAKTPVIAGTESAFAAIRKSEMDYLEVRNTNELLAALQRLKNDAGLRQQMTENGLQRAKEFNDESIAKQWAHLLFDEAPKLLAQWKQMSRLQKRFFYADLFLSRSLRAVKNKVAGRLHFTAGKQNKTVQIAPPLQKSETESTLARQNT